MIMKMFKFVLCVLVACLGLLGLLLSFGDATAEIWSFISSTFPIVLEQMVFMLAEITYVIALVAITLGLMAIIWHFMPDE